MLLGNACLDGHPLYHTVVRHTVVLHDDVVASGRPWAVSAAVPIGADAVIMAPFLTRSAPVDSVLRAGTRTPMVGSALGRSMLAFPDADARGALLDPGQRARLDRRCELIRRRGGLETAVNEIRPGMSAVAAAVLVDGGQAIASLAVSGPTKRLPLAPDPSGRSGCAGWRRESPTTHARSRPSASR